MEGEREPEGLQTQENTPPAHAFTDGERVRWICLHVFAATVPSAGLE